MKTIRVLVVDDSPDMREFLTEALKEHAGIEIVAAARDGLRGWQAFQFYQPDVVVLDADLAKGQTLPFIERIRKAQPTPVVLIASDDPLKTNEALQRGAVSSVGKRKQSNESSLRAFRTELLRKVIAAAESAGDSPTLVPSAPSIAPVSRMRRIDVVAVGASTGGIDALNVIFPKLARDLPPLVIVQHMPKHFTAALASRLRRMSKLSVMEARDGEILSIGRVYIAPAGEQHTEIVRTNSGYAIRLLSAEPVNRHRPSVDVLFHSCAAEAGKKAVGVLLTGMGDDGARGLLAMHKAGAHTMAQDEETSVVFGMPAEGIRRGAAREIVPLQEVAARIAHACR